MDQNVKKSFLIALQVGLGVFLAYAGGMKLFVSGVEVFLRDVGNFRIIGAPWDLIVAYTLPWLELVVGLCLVIDFQRRGASIFATLMTLVFIAAIASAWSRGLDLHCGCFGKSTEAVKYPQKMLALLVQLAVCGIILMRKSSPPENSEA